MFLEIRTSCRSSNDTPRRFLDLLPVPLEPRCTLPWAYLESGMERRAPSGFALFASPCPCDRPYAHTRFRLLSETIRGSELAARSCGRFLAKSPFRLRTEKTAQVRPSLFFA